MNIFNILTTIPKIFQLKRAFNTLNANEAALNRAREEGAYEKEREICLDATNAFVNDILKKFGVTVDIIGAENLPERGPVLFVANHQSYCDILMMYMANQRFQMGFIAKQEISGIKWLNKGIECTRSLFLKRDDPRAAVRTLNTAADMFDKGFSFVIFPEGTRSQSHDMAPFKRGSFKFAQKGGVPIVPVTLDGGYRMFEEHKIFCPCHTRVIIHPVVHYEQMNRSQQEQANREIEETIRQGLELSARLDAEKTE